MRPKDRAPSLGVVIPVYGHPQLLAEAIASALNQSLRGVSQIVVINDGCSLPETAQIAHAFGCADSKEVVTLSFPNAGLSAARNRGIDFLLGHFPSIEAIFMLDADNRLLPNAFHVFLGALANFPDDDWFYPQFDMFGSAEHATNGSQWSLLMHSADNVSEAGSLVRRRVFESGVRYDEQMRLGYEDWDFWLSAARRGFRGRAMTEPFFHYRKRPESMLSGSHRVDGEIRSYMRRKHAWLFNPKTALCLEHVEAPRTRLLLSDSARILAFTDPLVAGRKMDRKQFEQEVWRWLSSPDVHSCGDLWLFTNGTVWQSLLDSGLARFILWELERISAPTQSAALFLSKTEVADYNLEPCHIAGEDLSQASAIAVRQDLLRSILSDRDTNWLEAFLSGTSDPQPNTICLGSNRLPHGDLTRKSEVSNLILSTCAHLRGSRFRWTLEHKWTWRKIYCHHRSDASIVARKAADTGALFPLLEARDRKPSVCFLVPIALFGGAETVAANVARTMRQRGWRTALCIEGEEMIRMSSPVNDAFDDIMWFRGNDLRQWKGPLDTYLGTHLPQPLNSDRAKDLTGLLGPFDCVVACHAGASLSALGSLRKSGTVIVLHEHVVETSTYGRTLGPPMLALAYEAAADVIATCSVQMANWLHAHGVPESKLLPVPNAPGFQAPAAELARVLAARQKRPASQPLRALFLGRLDWQKGCDRIPSVIKKLRNRGIKVEWRVVGKSVVQESADVTSELSELVDLEEPVFSTADRIQIYNWADVLVLPSRYEGLPLTVLEAQQFGVVPIMTKVGAYDEVIVHSQNGFLVSQDDCVDEISLFLERLSSDTKLLPRMSTAASAQSPSWEDRTAPLIAKIESLVNKRRTQSALIWGPAAKNN